MPHITLPTHTSDINILKNMLDYLYSSKGKYDSSEIETDTGMREINHKINFLSYFNLIDKFGNDKLKFKLITQFIYTFWDVEEVRNKLLILSWFHTKLPGDWNRNNKEMVDCYIIWELFKVILSPDYSAELLINFLTDDANVKADDIDFFKQINIHDDALKGKVVKISGYFIGILKNLEILNKDGSINLKLLSFITELHKNMNKEDENIFIEKYIQKIIKDQLCNTGLNAQQEENKNMEPSYMVAPEMKKDPIPSTLSKNRLIYGAPGTGKSYLLNNEVERFFGTNYKRVTFYNGYTYGQFVGTYKPTPILKDISKSDMPIIRDERIKPTENHEPIISYEYVAGPFIELLVKAKQKPNENFCLIIEEINRTKADAVFGDIFQLLDRNDIGESEYSIVPSKELRKYLSDNLDDQDIFDIKIPKNMFIWATMNSADQGVFPLDTAFKRRWNFEYVSLNKNKNAFGKEHIKYKIPFKKDENEWKYISWNDFRMAINKELEKSKFHEDKLLAPFFIKSSDFENLESLENELTIKKSVLVNKILMYLMEDVLRYKDNSILFNIVFDSFSDLAEALEGEPSLNYGTLQIFNDTLTQKFDEISFR